VNFFGQTAETLQKLQLLSWQEAEIFSIPTESDPAVEKIIDRYLKDLKALGLNEQNQKIWMQSEWAFLADRDGKNPVSAASLSKIATTIAALDKLGVNYRFETKLHTLGTIDNGVLKGDLLLEGSSDPLMVWEEAIAIGNSLQKAGIREIQGNLIIVGKFYMNFKTNPQLAGDFFKRAINEALWSGEIKKQYETLPKGTARPKVKINGKIVTQAQLPKDAKILIHHQSLPLIDILKQMNIYSNNDIAQIIAEFIGGPKFISSQTAKLTKVPEKEIQMVNGSGLSVNNKISPRASVAMLKTLNEKYQAEGLNVPDLFPIAGQDKLGTMKFRNMPAGVTIKTGTLNSLSALAGEFTTKERGKIWFTVINYGGNIDRMRVEQDKLLQNLGKHWHIQAPVATNKKFNIDKFGNVQRNKIEPGREIVDKG
jgi:D-alanyl-D-alanine carboxypeptidase/D-alanyl-D-alanine-endopeptidase (penicillin-binding protein 4)